MKKIPVYHQGNNEIHFGAAQPQEAQREKPDGHLRAAHHATTRRYYPLDGRLLAIAASSLMPPAANYAAPIQESVAPRLCDCQGQARPLS